MSGPCRFSLLAQGSFGDPEMLPVLIVWGLVGLVFAIVILAIVVGGVVIAVRRQRRKRSPPRGFPVD